MRFEQLVENIELIHKELQKYAIIQVDNLHTIRNILIGFYIVEFEQNGEDRAKYGAKTISELTKKLNHIKGTSAQQLYKFRDFYNSYPAIFSTVLRQFKSADIQPIRNLPTVSGKFKVTSEVDELSFAPEVLLNKLSFSHFLELLNADNPLKRAFYEVQAIKNNWSVRELNRAMSSLLFERTGAAYGYYSANKSGLNPWTGKPYKSIAIGQTMDRVGPQAIDLGAETISKDWDQAVKKGQFDNNDVIAGKGFNKDWINEKIQLECHIFNAGQEPLTSLPISRNYNLELYTINSLNYQNDYRLHVYQLKYFDITVYRYY